MGNHADGPNLRRVLEPLWTDGAAMAEPVEPVAIVGLAHRAEATVDVLDASFFGTTGEGLSTRARACLELGWEALEDAGIAGPSGVMGAFVDDGEVRGFLADLLGLTGPVIRAGTGLSALHLAAASLRDGDVDLALVLGSDGEGGLASWVLRRVKDAVRHHDRVLSVILASGAASTDAAGLTRRLCRRAGLGLHHEVQPLPGEVLAAPTQARLERASLVGESGPDGVVQILVDAPAAAIAWARLELARDPTSDFEPVSARPPSGTPIPSPLRAKGRTPVPKAPAGPSAGRASVHTGERPQDHPSTQAGWYTAPADEPTPAGRQTVGVARDLDGGTHLLLISARSRAALRARVEQIGRVLAEGADPAQVAATLAHRRVHFEHRLFARPEALPHGPAAHTTRGVTEPARSVAFLFTGEGTHRERMAVELYDTEPVFRDTLNRCDALLRHHMERPLLTVLFPRGDRRELDDLVHAHAALFSVQFALSELWRYWGVVPGAVLGYGVGEYVAAVVAGVMRLEDAVALVAARARLVVEHVAPDGAQAVVGAPEDLVRSLLGRVGGRVAVAAVNSPEEVVVGGARPDVERLVGELTARGIAGTLLDGRYGFNSPHVDAALDPFEHVARLPARSLPRITYVSGRTGEIEATALMGAGYWRAQLREPVRFAAALQTLLEGGWDQLVEIGPKPLLARMVARNSASAVVLPSMDRERNDHDVMLESLGRLWLAGCPVDWSLRYGKQDPASLPAYPWQRGVEEVREDEPIAWGAYQEPDSFAIDLPPLPAEPTPTFAADDVPEPAQLQPPATEVVAEEPVTSEPSEPVPAEEPVTSEHVPTRAPVPQETAEDVPSTEEPVAAELPVDDALDTVDLISSSAPSPSDIDGIASAPAVFALAWQPIEPARSDAPEPATWILLTDGEGLGDYVATRLTELGHSSVRVRPEHAYARGDGTIFVSDPADPSAWSGLVQQLKAIEGPIRVLHLWTLDVVDDEQPDALQKGKILGPAALVHLKASLTAANREASVWVVTRGASPLGEEAGTVTSAASWGAARAAWPSCGWIDLDPLDEDPDAILDNVLADDGETRVVLRDGQRYGARLVQPPEGAAPALNSDGTWLLVAPFDDALPMGRWLFERGVRRLVFVPPRRPDGPGVQGMLALQKQGARTVLIPTDARRPAEVDRLLRRLEHEPPVVGVVLAPGLIGSDAWPSVRDELTAWVELGWTLHRAVAGEAAHFVALVSADPLLGGTMASGAVGAGLAGLVRHRAMSGGAGGVALWERTSPEDPEVALDRALSGGPIEVAILAPDTVARPLGRILDEITSG